VKELLSCPRAAGEELHVVDQHHVRAAKSILEDTGAALSHGGDELGRELLDRRVTHPQPRAEAPYVVADGVEQVGFAEPGRAVQEERVIGLGRQLRHGQGGRVGEVVSLADHELIEGVLGVQPALGRVGERWTFRDGSVGGTVRADPRGTNDLDHRPPVEAGGRGAA
jgi:hypothetical protein